LKRCHLQLNNLNKIIFVSKIWPSDPRVGYSSPSNLIELLRFILPQRKKIEQYEGEFERNELLDL